MTVAFQQRAVQHGAEFEETAGGWLATRPGWEVIDKSWNEPYTGNQIDIRARDQRGVLWWVECKGSQDGSYPGLLRNDTVKKLLGVAYDLGNLPPEQRCPYLILTSHQPSQHMKGYGMLQRAIQAGVIDCVISFYDGQPMMGMS